jgi:hypothetical protein
LAYPTCDVLEVVGASGGYLHNLLVGGQYGGVLPAHVVLDQGKQGLIIVGFQPLATVAQQRTHLFF